MELRHLRYFIAVAEELNFSRAAERLNVSQPPLSRQIRDLEDELNVKLFERTHQEVKLTTVGRTLLIRARELVREAELLRARAHQMEGEVYEDLQIGYAPAPTAAIISGILSRYHEMAPGSCVTLHDLSLSEILTGIKTKKLHAGLTLRPRPGEMRGVEFEGLRRYSVGIICAKSCPLAQLPAIRPSAVPAGNLVGYRATEFPEYHPWVAKVLGVNKTRVVISQECDGVLSLVAAVDHAKHVGAKIIGILGRDGGYTARHADATVIVPTVNARTVTAHTEALQAVIWHLLVSHPGLKPREGKWESLDR